MVKHVALDSNGQRPFRPKPKQLTADCGMNIPLCDHFWVGQ